MVALVTGATGFIGSHLVEFLIEKGYTVRILIRKSSRLEWLHGKPIEWILGDLERPNLAKESLKGVDYVFHLAGVIDTASKKRYFQVNTEGTRRLLEAFAETKVPLKRFVLVGSQAAGGPSHLEKGVREDDPPHPVSYYGASKLAAEKEALRFKNQFPIVILRPPTIYGPREKRVFRAFQMMQRGYALAVGNRPKYISFCYVADLVRAIELVAKADCPSGRVYNITSSRPYEWLEFIEAIGKSLQCSYRIYRIPEPLLLLFGLGGEIYSRLSQRSTLFTWQKVKEFVQNSWAIDGTRIQNELGWREETPLSEGLSRTAEWYRKEDWL